MKELYIDFVFEETIAMSNDNKDGRRLAKRFRS